MEYRNLGSSGLRISVLGFGAMTFGGTGYFSSIGETRGADAARQIAMCLEGGVNLFDTADVYSGGESEEILGTALGARRHEVHIATKFFGQMGQGVNDAGGSRHHIIRACEASLRRLGTDYIDLYQIHNQDLSTPLEETVRALDDLVRMGKVRYVGASNHAGWYMMKALATADRLRAMRYVSQQIQYSLLVRDAENELLPLGRAEGLGGLIWSPLAMGYLTGKFRGAPGSEKTRLAARNQLIDRHTERGRRIVDMLATIAAEREGATMSQVALNWVASKAGVSSIIIGARTDAQLADNLAASTWSLTEAEVARLDAVSATKPRYPYDMHRLFART